LYLFKKKDMTRDSSRTTAAAKSTEHDLPHCKIVIAASGAGNAAAAASAAASAFAAAMAATRGGQG
jgi:hypothetical protein